jgi:hypothetical protein
MNSQLLTELTHLFRIEAGSALREEQALDDTFYLMEVSDALFAKSREQVQQELTQMEWP